MLRCFLWLKPILNQLFWASSEFLWCKKWKVGFKELIMAQSLLHIISQSSYPDFQIEILSLTVFSDSNKAIRRHGARRLRHAADSGADPSSSADFNRPRGRPREVAGQAQPKRPAAVPGDKPSPWTSFCGFPGHRRARSAASGASSTDTSTRQVRNGVIRKPAAGLRIGVRRGGAPFFSHPAYEVHFSPLWHEVGAFPLGTWSAHSWLIRNFNDVSCGWSVRYYVPRSMILPEGAETAIVTVVAPGDAQEGETLTVTLRTFLPAGRGEFRKSVYVRIGQQQVS